MKKLLILSFLLILPFSCFPGGKLILQTSDGDSIECTQEQQAILMQSQTIKDMLEDLGDDDESIVPLADISTNTFNQIMECLEPLAEMETLKAELEALEGQDKNHKELEIKAKKSTIILKLNNYSEADLLEAIPAISFLHIPQLLHYSCKIWSDNYELKRLSNNKPSFNNQEIIEKLKEINFSSIKSFFIKKYFENYSPDVKILHYKKIINSLCYSPDGTLIASDSSDKKIRIWDALTGQPLNTLKGHKQLVLPDCYSSDSTQFASASEVTIGIWDTTTYKRLHTLKGHKQLVVSVCYSPDDTQIASSSLDKTIRIWDIGEPVRNLKKQDYNQLLLHTLCKKKIENNKTVDMVNNSHLLEIFNSLQLQQRAFLTRITPMKLPLTKQISLQLYNYKRRIATTTGAV